MVRLEQLKKRLDILNMVMSGYSDMPQTADASTSDILEDLSLMLDWKGELEKEIQNLTNTEFGLESYSAGIPGQAR